jgi:ribonucleoside-diphosphate reductase alpha chain
MYYLRTQAATQAVQFTVEKQGGQQMEPMIEKKAEAIAIEAKGTKTVDSKLDEVEFVEGAVCTMEEGCVTCSA